MTYNFWALQIGRWGENRYVDKGHVIRSVCNARNDDCPIQSAHVQPKQRNAETCRIMQRTVKIIRIGKAKTKHPSSSKIHWVHIPRS